MPNGKEKKSLCVDNLRHAEYYGMIEIFDKLYERSKNGEIFTNLMEIILMRENILLAYRNIKANKGSKTAGTDKLTIDDIGKLTDNEVVNKVRYILTGSKHGYRPKPVRRKEIPKSYDPTKTRPLGIPCIWDRLVQQCIKQGMEPICEAKFSHNSYGFRPNRSVENAGDAILQKTYTEDCISHKKVKNHGEKNKYIVYDCHPAIIDRDTYNRVQQELTRRGAISKRSPKAEIEQGHYASKYALSDILICGECGTAYRRVTWTSHGHKLVVWRCINRLDYGNRYCHDSPSINEEKLHNAIVYALNSAYADGEKMLETIKQNITAVMIDKDISSAESDRIKSRLSEISEAKDKLIRLITSGAVDEDSLDKEFEDLITEEKFLKQTIADLKHSTDIGEEKRYHMMSAFEELQKSKCCMTQYDEVTVRKVIECIRVLSKTEIQVIFKGGFEMNVSVEK